MARHVHVLGCKTFSIHNSIDIILWVTLLRVKKPFIRKNVFSRLCVFFGFYE